MAGAGERRAVRGTGREELVEVIIQMAFYSGWPNAVVALGVAQQVFEEARR